MIRDVLYLLRNMPDYFAWRLEAFAIRLDDFTGLSPLVRDAFWSVREGDG